MTPEAHLSLCKDRLPQYNWVNDPQHHTPNSINALLDGVMYRGARVYLSCIQYGPELMQKYLEEAEQEAAAQSTAKAGKRGRPKKGPKIEADSARIEMLRSLVEEAKKMSFSFRLVHEDAVSLEPPLVFLREIVQTDWSGMMRHEIVEAHDVFVARLSEMGQLLAAVVPQSTNEPIEASRPSRRRINAETKRILCHAASAQRTEATLDHLSDLLIRQRFGKLAQRMVEESAVLQALRLGLEAKLQEIAELLKAT